MSSSYERDVIEDARGLLLDKLDEIDVDDFETYGAELWDDLLEEDWANGTLTFSAKEAYDYIMAHPRAAASTHDYLAEIDTNLNPFDDAERFHLTMISEIIRTLLAKCPTVDRYWNDKIKLDEQMRDDIKAEIEAIDIDSIER